MAEDKLHSLASYSSLGRELVRRSADKRESQKEALAERKPSGLQLQTFGSAKMGTPFPYTAFLHKNGHIHPLVYIEQLLNVVLAGKKTSKGITVCSPPFHTLQFVLLRPIIYWITSDKSRFFKTFCEIYMIFI